MVSSTSGVEMYYRYVSAMEAKYAAVHGHAPNRDTMGLPKNVYFTDAWFESARAVESELRVGRHHPAGSQPAPTDRLDLDLTGKSFSGPTVIPGSPTSRNEFMTADCPVVTAINPLLP